jgi:hypothetical protein
MSQSIEDAFNSMLRADYIPLKDTAKLSLLSEYYVDYYGFLRQIISENDQLIVGRRGTGKTTLLYRTLVECMRSWHSSQTSVAKPRTLAIYLDLNKCQALSDCDEGDFAAFEHVFASELCDSITEEIRRSWPAIDAEPGFFSRLFKSAEERNAQSTRNLLNQLAMVLKSGLPRVIDPSGIVEQKDAVKTKKGTEGSAATKASKAGFASATFTAKYAEENSREQEDKSQYSVTYRLTIADILRVLGDLRATAEISAIYLLVDEFSALNEDLQRRFSTLLKKLIGNHIGLYVKLCGITDKYTLGSSVILQRDLFEVSLDLDAFVERSDSLNAAMGELETLAEQMVTQRLLAYGTIDLKTVFEDTSDIWKELSRAAMGVPRTLGIVLKQAWNRAAAGKRKIKRSDIEYGIRYASKAYLNQLQGASKDSTAIPAYIAEIWDATITKAIAERAKIDAPASHFMVLPKNEAKIKYLSMFFVVHLLTSGRTTKKEKFSRSLYCIDYGICLENNLMFATDKNILRQQRFAYDDDLAQFDAYFEKEPEPRFICKECSTIYLESELRIRGKVLTICITDHSQLQPYNISNLDKNYTEEEIKIIGAIRSASSEEKVVARQVADDVGCYVQKVAKFGEKLEREGVIARERIPELQKNIYYGPDPEAASQV